MKKYITKQSNIKGAGKGLFTKDFFKKGEVIGLAHVDDQPASEIGRNHNHNEKNPTAYSKKIDNKRFIYASRNLKPGEEITTNYRMQPELEQPEDFMRKGGSVLRLPNKKNSKGYSRSLSATNKLFTQNFLFEKPKSRKNKVFDPNSKYYAEGGSLLTKKVTCKSCGWKWDAEDGGNDITTCHKCGGQGLIHAQKGGNKDAMTGMMKARLAYANEFGNPAAKRMINIPDNPYQFDNGDIGTHYMASYDNYAVPQIQDENGVLQLGDYGPESNEAIRFDSDEDANYFAENYKNVSPGFINKKQYGGLNKFVEGGNPCSYGYIFVNGECIPDQNCEDGRCEETDQIQNILDEGSYIPKKNVNMMWDVVDQSSIPELSGGDRKNAKKIWSSKGAQSISERLGMDNAVNCMWAAGMGYQCLPETKGKITLMPFESNDKFINAVNKGTIPFSRITKTHDPNFASKETGMLQQGDIINFKGPNISHAMTFSNYDNKNNPIFLDSNGSESDLNWNRGLWKDIIPDKETVAYVSRFNPEKFYEKKIKILEEKARTNPTIIEKQNGGYIEADLNEDEIEEYRKGGYIVEEIDTYQKGGSTKLKYKKPQGASVHPPIQKILKNPSAALKWSKEQDAKNLIKKEKIEEQKALEKAKNALIYNEIKKLEDFETLKANELKKPEHLQFTPDKYVIPGSFSNSYNPSNNIPISDNTNIYRQPMSVDWSLDPKYQKNIQLFLAKQRVENAKAAVRKENDSYLKEGLANNENIEESVGQYNRRKKKYDDLNFIQKIIETDPADNYKPQPVGRSPFEDSPMTGIGGAPKMILKAGKWLKPLLTGTKNATQPFRQATVSALKAPLPLGRRITNATEGKLNLGNSVAAYFGADALYNQGDSKSDVVNSQSNFINNPSWYTLGDAAFETGVNSLGFSGLGLGKQVFKPTYNASKKLIKGFKGIPKQLSGSSNTPIVNTKMGFDFGMDMSKYEIKNPDYFTQLLNTYDSKALSTTNKKFYKDLIKSVKNQNNIATERQYGELQRLKTGNFNFGKKGYANGGTTNNYIELDLTPEEIQRYKNGGYIIEEIDTYQNGGVNKKGKSYDYTRDPTYTERFKRFFGMEDVDDIAYEKVDNKNIKKYKQTTEPIKKTIRKIPTIENKSNFELDLKNRLQNISKENILKEKNISKVEPIKNSLQITGNNNSNIKNKIVKPEDSFFESTYKEIKSFNNWLDNQKKLFNNGLDRKLQTWGIVETKDKKVIESPEPINVKDYYKNPTLSQTILNVNDQPNRQFKQQTVPTSNLVLGSRNRGQYQDIESDGLEFTTFHPFNKAVNIKPYNKKTNVNGINDDNSVFALDNKGVLHTGIYKNLKNNKDWKFSRTFMNKIVSIDDISLDGARSGNPKFWQPQITILENNKLKKGALNILTKKGKAEEDYYGSILGGRVVFVNPLTKEQTLVSGSVSHIKKEFKRLKGNSKYLEAWSLDNGTYARGLSYKDGKLTKQRLVDYDAENTSGGNGLYIKKYNVPVNKFKETYVYDMPNVRTKKDDSYKAGHKLKNEIKNFVLHHTAYDNPITNEAEVKKQFMTPGQNSSHVVIEEDGSRTIYASPEQVSFHAGKSKWNGREDVNDFSIGVEFQGDTQKKPLTDQQVISFVEYYAPIAKKYNLNLKSIITHEQIRNAYIKKHANEKGLETKPDITYNQYKRILNYMKAKGIN